MKYTKKQLEQIIKGMQNVQDDAVKLLERVKWETNIKYNESKNIEWDIADFIKDRIIG